MSTQQQEKRPKKIFKKNFFVALLLHSACYNQTIANDKRVESRQKKLIIIEGEKIMNEMIMEKRSKLTEMLIRISGNKKAVLGLKIGVVALLAIATVLSFTNPSYAAAVDINLDPAVHPVLNLINKLVNPLMLLVGAGGVVFCIVMGVKYATAEEPQEREKRKQALKTAIIGYLLIFVLVVILKLSIGPLTQWMVGNTTATTTKAK